MHEFFQISLTFNSHLIGQTYIVGYLQNYASKQNLAGNLCTVSLLYVHYYNYAIILKIGKNKHFINQRFLY